MTPRQLHADAESVHDADLLNEIANKSMSSPICDHCALEHGAIEPARTIIALSKQPCSVCGKLRMCTGLRDWRWERSAWASINRRSRMSPLETK